MLPTNPFEKEVTIGMFSLLILNFTFLSIESVPS